MKKYSLCPKCECCPEIEIECDEQAVIIREDNEVKVRLEKTCWNYLVNLIKEGKLKEL